MNITKISMYGIPARSTMTPASVVRRQIGFHCFATVPGNGRISGKNTICINASLNSPISTIVIQTW